MSKATRLGWGAALLGILLVLAIACEDSGVIPPSDGSITASLNPSSLTVNAGSQGQSTVLAYLLNKDGAAVEGANVIFTSTDGQLVKPGTTEAANTAFTDAQGLARLTLLVTADDADDIDVTVQAGALTSTATLSKGVVGQPRPPSASFTIEPCGTPCAGEVNRSVTFTSTSTDPNPGDQLVFRWTLDSSAGGAPQVVGPTQSTRFSRTFSSAQDLHVTLEVSDDPNALTSPGTAGIWDDQVTKDYKICANRAPVADAQATVNGRSATVDGSGSTDPDPGETATLTFNWQCGNGTTATGETAVCNYTATQTGSFTITLTVTDAPDGCAARTDTDTTVVNIQ
jgi:hypothetical protein